MDLAVVRLSFMDGTIPEVAVATYCSRGRPYEDVLFILPSVDLNQIWMKRTMAWKEGKKAAFFYVPLSIKGTGLASIFFV